MVLKKNLLLTVLSFALLISCDIEDKDIRNIGNLEGIIQNEFGQPIEGALVELEAKHTRSDFWGEYSFENLEAKEYPVSVSKEHYLTMIKKVSIIMDETINMNFTLIAGDIFLDISDSIMILNAKKGSFIIEVSSNADWLIKNTSSWIECSIETGKGNSSVRFSYSINPEESSRSDTINFISGPLNKSLIINQSAPIKIINYEGIIGNGELEIKDSVYILFNKPIQVNSIKANWENCISEIKYDLTDNNHGVRFNYSCARLGGNYNFTITLYDEFDEVYSLSLDIPFYRSRLDIEGYITDYLLLNDDKEVLISTYLPSRLTLYSIELDSILKTIDLSRHISPINIFHNPYNSKIYVIGSDPDTYWVPPVIDRPDIFTINLQTNEITKAITLEPDEDDHPQAPMNIPFNIGFTKSGVGIVLIRDEYATTSRWKYIDCADNYNLYSCPLNGNTIGIESIYMNYDNTKLYFTQPFGSCDYGIFDESTKQISILRPGSCTRGVFITPHRKSEKFYAGQLKDQFIIDLHGKISESSYLDNRGTKGADFSYRASDDNIIYFHDDSYFYVLDYNNSTTLMWCDIISINNFKATTDGKNAVAFKRNYADYSSSLYVFDTKYFHIE